MVSIFLFIPDLVRTKTFSTHVTPEIWGQGENPVYYA